MKKMLYQFIFKDLWARWRQLPEFHPEGRNAVQLVVSYRGWDIATFTLRHNDTMGQWQEVLE